MKHPIVCGFGPQDPVRVIDIPFIQSHLPDCLTLAVEQRVRRMDWSRRHIVKPPIASPPSLHAALIDLHEFTCAMLAYPFGNGFIDDLKYGGFHIGSAERRLKRSDYSPFTFFLRIVNSTAISLKALSFLARSFFTNSCSATETSWEPLLPGLDSSSAWIAPFRAIASYR